MWRTNQLVKISLLNKRKYLPQSTMVTQIPLHLLYVQQNMTQRQRYSKKITN